MSSTHQSSSRLGALTLAALGIVFGDIGTSPLYALKQVFAHGHLALTPANIYGILSLMFWTLTVVVSLKYVLLILRADNNGEGGLIAMLALASQADDEWWAASSFAWADYRSELAEALQRDGRVFVARPPLFRIDIGKETFWALDERHKEEILTRAGTKGKVEITRFKGLGEMMPATLYKTTLDPDHRRLYRVRVADDERLVTETTITELMGRDAQARFEFVMSRAHEVQELDI